MAEIHAVTVPKWGIEMQEGTIESRSRIRGLGRHRDHSQGKEKESDSICHLADSNMTIAGLPATGDCACILKLGRLFFNF